MNPTLKKSLLRVSSGGALAIAIVLIPWLEGTEYKPYQDVGGVWTVCSGVTGSDVIPGKTYTPSECDTLLKKHIKLYADTVDKSVRVPVNDYQKAALISLSYNVGISAFKHSSLLRHLNAGQYQQACDDMRDWVYVNKVKIKGLMNRREVEREICMWGEK